MHMVGSSHKAPKGVGHNTSGMRQQVLVHYQMVGTVDARNSLDSNWAFVFLSRHGVSITISKSPDSYKMLDVTFQQDIIYALPEKYICML